MKHAVLFAFTFLMMVRTNSQTLPDSQKRIFSKTMSQRWELDQEDKKGTFRLTSYKPFYVTAGRRSNNPNVLPQSENPDFSATVPKNFNNYEARFQLSLKKKYCNRFCSAKVIYGSRIPKWPIGKFTTRNFQGLFGN